MRIFTSHLVTLSPSGIEFGSRDAHPYLFQTLAQSGFLFFGHIDRNDFFPKQIFQRRHIFHSVQTTNKSYPVFEVLAETLQDARRHKMVESRNGLPAVLLILVGLENDGGQRGITLYGLRRTHRTVLGMESPVEDILQIILYASGRLGGIVIEVVNVYVAFPVRPSITNPDQIFIGIIFRDLRGECHHLPCRCMRRHIGIAQVYVVLLDRHDTVHHLLHRCALFTFFGTPLPINDKFLRYRGIAHHQFALYQILNLFYRDILPIDGSGNLGRNLFNRGLVVVHTVGTISLSDSPLDFLNREVLFGSITFRNGNTCIVHADCY